MPPIRFTRLDPLREMPNSAGKPAPSSWTASTAEAGPERARMTVIVPPRSGKAWSFLLVTSSATAIPGADAPFTPGVTGPACMAGRLMHGA